MSALVPGQWLGMVGGGQLARMFCYEAHRLGYKVAVLDPDPSSPAGAVADLHICAAYTDTAALQQLGQQCAVISTEFENVPAQSLEFLEQYGPVRPSAQAVAVIQNRISEKEFITKAGVAVAPYAAIRSEADLAQADEQLFPGILKAARFGYDGKGQIRVQTRAQAQAAFAELNHVECVLEALQSLKAEISVVLARATDGAVALYTAAYNQHLDGILALSTPAHSAQLPSYHQQAQQAAVAIAQALDYVGVLCVEFFVLEGGRLVANEIAPRPHNSGHHTIEACYSSQFEQQVRIMAALPLGDSSLLMPACMFNVLGDVWFDEKGHRIEPDWAALAALSGVYVHMYGKAEARPGRKMGHITVVAPTNEQLHQRAQQVAHVLGFDWYE